jgi:hypothetical protein
MPAHFRRSLLLSIFSFVPWFATAPVLAQGVQALVEQCRDTQGRPMVQACLASRGKGADWEACRETAGPQVRACAQERGRTEGAIVHCRQTVGRSIVDACMQRRGLTFDLEGCRERAAPTVQACVRQGLIVAFGQARFDRAVEHCRQTVGRPIVHSCMAGQRANLEACRSKASPKVRACVRQRLSDHGGAFALPPA